MKQRITVLQAIENRLNALKRHHLPPSFFFHLATCTERDAPREHLLLVIIFSSPQGHT